jgi:hypothetical protein
MFFFQQCLDGSVTDGTDALLVRRLAAGDDHALAEIFDSLGPAVTGDFQGDTAALSRLSR